MRPPSEFNRVARRFAETAAERVGVVIDTGVYDKVRAFRAPNSRHPKTGLHKRRLTLDELLGLRVNAIVKLAAEPEAFDVPAVAEDGTARNKRAIDDWRKAAEQLKHEATARRERRQQAGGAATMNRSTMEFIRDGATTGDRHRLLFPAAANLAEFSCPASLAHALLAESGLDSGLSPSDVRRQIECGLSSICADSTPRTSEGTAQTRSSDPTDRQAAKRDTADSGGFERQSCQQVTGAT